VQGLKKSLDVASTHFLAASAAFANVFMAVDVHLTLFICRLVRDEVGPACVPSQVYASHALPFRLHYDVHGTLSATTYYIPLTVLTLTHFQDLYEDVTPELVFGQREHETVLVAQYGRRQEWPRDVLLLAEEGCTAGHVVSGELAPGDRPPMQEDYQHLAEHVAQLHEARQEFHTCIPYGQNIQTPFPTGGYTSTIAHASACLPLHPRPDSVSIWTAKAEGGGREAMDWKNLQVSSTGTVDHELPVRTAYLVTENCMLRNQSKGCVRLSDGERKTLAEIGQKLGKQALTEVATIVTPDTILAWPRTLVAQKCDGSQQRQTPGRPKID